MANSPTQAASKMTIVEDSEINMHQRFETPSV